MEKKRKVIRKNERSPQELKNLGTKSKGQIFVFLKFSKDMRMAEEQRNYSK